MKIKYKSKEYKFPEKPHKHKIMIFDEKKGNWVLGYVFEGELLDYFTGKKIKLSDSKSSLWNQGLWGLDKIIEKMLIYLYEYKYRETIKQPISHFDPRISRCLYSVEVGF